MVMIEEAVDQQKNIIKKEKRKDIIVLRAVIAVPDIKRNVKSFRFIEKKSRKVKKHSSKHKKDRKRSGSDSSA